MVFDVVVDSCSNVDHKQLVKHVAGEAWDLSRTIPRELSSNNHLLMSRYGHYVSSYAHVNKTCAQEAQTISNASHTYI